ncbi:HMCN1 [Symbiodinium natans]|uniref:HMCN1 protein n=1 Tax=Symbiodinium natans TaxID=878477 RepID=A0A812JCM1_9DINO|nr:HMCN1 [Symbiodinium natans]
MQFCRYFTVIMTCQNAWQFRLQAHENADAGFQQSSFRIILIDSCGSLMSMLQHIETAYYSNGNFTVAVDFEGVDLCRTGELCLLQITCSDDPTLVYVLDVHILGQKAFLLDTPRGMSMKTLLEDQRLGILERELLPISLQRRCMKLWFDPRNDVDALNVFDLQLAEVAVRRSGRVTALNP